MTNYNKLTKAQLIELLNEKDEKYNQLLTRANKIIKDKNDEIKALKADINDYQQTIQELKDKYESDDFEKFVEVHGSLADRMITNNIQKEYLIKTGIKLTYKEITTKLENIKYKVKKINKAGINGYATKRIKGFIYLIQLENERGESIYKIGMTYNMIGRTTDYFNDYNTNVILFLIFEVDDMFECEDKLIDMLNNDKRLQLAHGEEFFKGDYKVIEEHYLDAVNMYNGVECDVDDIIQRKKARKDGLIIIKGLQ